MNVQNSLAAENARLKRKMNKMEVELASLKKDNTPLKRKINKLEAENSELKKENAKLKTALYGKDHNGDKNSGKIEKK